MEDEDDTFFDESTDDGRFKPGNAFWKNRSRHGRHKLFETPASLWEAACEYFQWCDDNPLMEAEVVAYKGFAKLVDLPKRRAYTTAGFMLYIDASDSYLKNLKHNFKVKDDEYGRAMTEVLEQIDRVIYEQKFTNAAVGMFNANFIARDLGMVDKKQITAEVTTNDALDLSQLSDEELEQYHALARKSTKKD